MVLGSSRLHVVLIGLLVGACFSEPGVETTGVESTGGCSAGQQGCPCYANGTCDGILACDVDTFVCVPDGCTPGELDCVCVNGSCLSPLVCLGSICVQDGGTSAGDASDSGSQSATLSTSAVDTGGGSDSDATSDATSGATSETTTVGTGDTGTPECDDATCENCLTCVLQPGAPCHAVHDTCVGDPVCAEVHECLEYCVENQFCDATGCCEGLGPETADKADEVISCQQSACAVACNDYTFWNCP
jgi:hypothetical protein